MKPRNTLILLVLAILAGAALWHFELRAGAKTASEGAEKKVFAGLDAKQVEWVELPQADGASVRIEKRGEAWRLTKPFDFAADEFAAGAIASGLADLASSSLFDPAAEDAAQHPEPLASYGLTREPRQGECDCPDHETHQERDDDRCGSPARDRAAMREPQPRQCADRRREPVGQQHREADEHHEVAHFPQHQHHD